MTLVLDSDDREVMMVKVMAVPYNSDDGAL